ncbi:hypothetical protein SAMN05660691_00040 [Rheinheimera pacifica]|uniref:Uncharacterized protein n=1 Tax=Rheinheimera pacifica TaxID=173990 RepID=A0A1H6J5Q5_9GAMM|nr:hypothetical protein [Rheinheimera pacifica]SEH54851.1 hypothetical protein SAMN05660691_00040 [Rheinheimera pacifica]
MAALDDVINHDKQSQKAFYIKVITGFFAVLLLLVVVWLALNWFAASASAPVAGAAPGAPLSATSGPAASGIPDEQARKALQQLLSDTNNQVNQLAADPYLVAWQSAAVNTLVQNMQQAYRLYGQQLYSETGTLLRDIQQQSSALQQNYTQAYETAYQTASAAFANTDLPVAQLNNSRALAVNPLYAPALQLQQRLDVATQVQELWQQVRVAQLENNVSKQKTLLESIRRLDPAEQQAQQRLAALNQQAQQQSFADVVAQAVAALDQADYATARQALARARSIDSSRSELVNLQRRLDSAEKAGAAAQAEQQIQVFIEVDEWPTVKMLAENGLKLNADNPVLQQALQNANQIIQAGQRLQSFLASPQRLTDANIRQRANEAIAAAQPLITQSDKLAQQLNQLQSLLQAQAQPVAVLVKSDGRTSIRVLGVGHVGEVKEKTINLLPGTYQFEGSCKGYRTEIISVEVSPAMPAVQLQCKTRI